MMDVKHSMTSKIANYVTRLLRLLADKKTRTLTFHDEADFMQKLYDYTYNQQRLKSTTLFCSIRVTNYYALDAHERLIDTVVYFLRENSVNSKVGDVSIQIVKNLLQLVLYNNLFVYKNKVYRFVKGSPSTMALSDLVSHIYLYEWQQSMLKEVTRHRELFGR